MNTERLIAIHKKEIEMILAIDSLFKKENISYWLLEGSVLGSVRHSGFIPWDDDIDIGILRKDFNKAESLLARLKPYIYESAKNHTISKSPIGCLYYVDENYTLDNSPFIDVFALDRIPKGRFLRKIWRFSADVYNLCIYKHPAQNRGLFMKISTFLFLLVIPQIIRNFVLKIAYVILTYWSDNDNLFICNTYSGYGEKDIFDDSMYRGNVLGKFENIFLPLPANPDLYLTTLYGNYMQLPPMEKRHPEHLR